MKTILVTTDFSPAAENAADYAADMAVALNTSLHVLHTYQFPVIYGEIPLAANFDNMVIDTNKKLEDAKTYLAKRTAGKINIAVEAREGNFFLELKIVCERMRPYAVIMGSQGTTASDRLLFGGHTVYAMKHLEWPLITIPPGAHFSAIKKIGLACDLHKVPDSTPVQEIKLLVKDLNARLHILNIGKKTAYDPEIVFQSGMLQELLSSLRPEYHFLDGKNTDEGILDFAEKNKIDLLIVLPKRRRMLNALFHKSHTKQFVLHSHVPVMALHYS